MSRAEFWKDGGGPMRKITTDRDGNPVRVTYPSTTTVTFVLVEDELVEDESAVSDECRISRCANCWDDVCKHVCHPES